MNETGDIRKVELGKEWSSEILLQLKLSHNKYDSLFPDKSQTVIKSKIRVVLSIFLYFYSILGKLSQYLYSTN